MRKPTSTSVPWLVSQSVNKQPTPVLRELSQRSSQKGIIVSANSENPLKGLGPATDGSKKKADRP